MQELLSVLNIPKYGWICLNRTGICLSMPEFAVIERVLNMSHTIHSVKSHCRLRSTYWEMGVFRTLSKIWHSVLNIWKGSEYVLGFKDVGSEYSRIANMPGFWISWVIQSLPIFVNMTGFWICVGMQLWKGPEYSGFQIYQVSTYANIY